jgi:hypothetical protein
LIFFVLFHPNDLKEEKGRGQRQLLFSFDQSRRHKRKKESQISGYLLKVSIFIRVGKSVPTGVVLGPISSLDNQLCYSGSTSSSNCLSINIKRPRSHCFIGVLSLLLSLSLKPLSCLKFFRLSFSMAIFDSRVAMIHMFLMFSLYLSGTLVVFMFCTTIL